MFLHKPYTHGILQGPYISLLLLSQAMYETTSTFHSDTFSLIHENVYKGTENLHSGYSVPLHIFSMKFPRSLTTVVIFILFRRHKAYASLEK